MIASENRAALLGVVVVELGERIAASVCCSWLAQLGATVVVIENPASRSDKSMHRDRLCVGKLSLARSEADRALIHDLLARSDVIVTSSDADEQLGQLASDHQVICDITAFGTNSADDGDPLSDAQLQAFTGVLDTNGPNDGPPTLVPFPVIEYLAGMHAAGACLAALRQRRHMPEEQRLDIALYDAGFAAISSFLTRSLASHDLGPTRRIGNRHSLSAPWNVYRASDGWVQICTGSDTQWQRLCQIIGKPELSQDPRYDTSTARVANIGEVDDIVQAWTRGLPALDCVEVLNAAHIPSGPIAVIDAYPQERNLLYRNMILEAQGSRDKVFLPGSPFRMSETPGRALNQIPALGSGRDEVTKLVAARTASLVPPSPQQLAAPLADIRILEIGHYTTAPVAARYLGGLGADVIKIEPPDGEASRAWPPHRAGQSLFYTVSNSDKRAITLDLTSPEGMEQLTKLIATADVLIENLKPGTLARRGLPEEKLRSLNPRLIYCAISGFGAHSLYAGRAAFDTVVQAMSGLMDIQKGRKIPLKAGISVADLMGASAAVAAILAALIHRDQTGRGQIIDLSMQDILAWSTQLAWDKIDTRSSRESEIVECEDGFTFVALGPRSRLPDNMRQKARTMSRERWTSACREIGISGTPIKSPSEVLISEQTARRELIFEVEDERGSLPALASPLRLHRTPYRLRSAAPALGQHNREILGEAWAAAMADGNKKGRVS